MMKHQTTLLLLCICQFLKALGGATWTVEKFPKPDFGLIADPDGLLSDLSKQSIQEKIESVLSTNTLGGVPIQLAVAVTSKMDIPVIMEEEEEVQEPIEELAAQDFARRLHDKWGVGADSESGGTGVLVFLSVDDRVIYISRGGSFDVLLRDSRIDTIISQLRPSLEQAKYGEGLGLAVELIGHFIEQGEPTWKELIWDYLKIEYAFVVLYASSVLYSIVKHRRLRREQQIYAEAATRLSEMDRAQAQALQGQYEAKSCPICLEEFISDKIGSDERPIKLLRCGHVFDESCWNEWVSSGQGNVTRCPICKKDVGPEIPAGETPQAAIVEDNNTIVVEDNNATGNNERAIRLFRQERNFRLVRLAARYPNYITQNQIQRWISPTYNGSLSQDRTFTQNRPRVHEARPHNQRDFGGSSAGFGGGTSSGGRGGRF